MFKEAIKYYISTGQASPEEVDILDRMYARQSTREAFFAGMDSEMNRGFIRIERVTSPDPVILFGQNAPSYAFNRITVSAGLTGEDGERKPGPSLMTALISEESLAKLMLSQNKSSQSIGLTAESYGDLHLPPREGPGRRSSGELLAEAMDRFLRKRSENLDSIEAIISDLDKGIAKQTAHDLKWMLERLCAGGDEEFLLKRHAENLQKDLVQYRVEASAAALNIEDIMRGIEQKRLAPPEEILPVDLEAERICNPLLDAAMELFRPEEALACRKALVAFMRKRITEVFPGGLGYDPDQDDPHAKNFRAATPFEHRKRPEVQELENMASVIGSLGNEHVNARRNLVDGYAMTASCSNISGGGHDLHASFPINDMGYFCLRFSSAVLEESFGNEDILDGGVFLEIGMSPEDMMTALRGHPAGEHIPCSIDRIAGRSIPRVPFESEMERTICDAGDDRSFILLKEQLEALIKEAKDLIDGGLKRVSERRMMRDVVSRIADTSMAFNEAGRENLIGRADSMNSQVREMANEAMLGIDAFVMEKHGVSLLSISTLQEDAGEIQGP